MDTAPLLFTVVAGILLIVLPRRSAVIPLLLAALYTTREPVVELGPATMTVLRILVLIGFTRALLRGERLAGGVNALDGLVLTCAVLMIATSLFHVAGQVVFRLGLVLGECGVYFLCRIFIKDLDDVRWVCRVVSVMIVPLAILMLLEKYTATNYFTAMGHPPDVEVRLGNARAAGSFAHPILAGMVGATCVPMALCLWRSHRTTALVGLCAATSIVLASASSSPVLMAASICGAMFLWNVRDKLTWIRWLAVAAVIALQLVMNDPVYFLMARVDIAGGSTGWFRAQLIRSSLQHFGEWWAVGTDYTRHWMPSGISANQNHTDMTNYLLAMGVRGGLPLLTAFVFMLRAAFRRVGAALQAGAQGACSPEQQFLTWTLGAMLFGQVVNFFSISLFDQSVSFLYLLLAMIGAVQHPAAATAAEPVVAPTIGWPRPSVALRPRAATPGSLVPAGAASVRPSRWRRTVVTSPYTRRTIHPPDLGERRGL